MESGDSSWSEPIVIMDYPSTLFGPDICTDGLGRIWAVSVGSPWSNLDLYYTQRGCDTCEWTVPEQINEPDTNDDQDRMSSVIMQPNGRPRVFWDAVNDNFGDHQEIMTSVWLGNGWSPEKVVSLPDSILVRADYEADGDCAPDGTVWVTWRRVDPPYWTEHIYAAHSVWETGAESEFVSVSPNPQRLKLEQNYPNPFNPTTRISYRLSGESKVTLAIHDVSGGLVKTLVDEVKSAGSHHTTWKGLDVAGNRMPSGVYFCKLVSEETRITRKMILLK
jgi:hypothetical protein